MGKGRQRGVVLTPQGQAKLSAARRQVEQAENFGQRFTLEELCERTQLSLKTITKVLEAKTTVDRQTLDAFFAAFHLTLDRADYGFPDPNPASPTPASPLPPPRSSPSASPSPPTSWGSAIDVSHFYGREPELAILKQWILADRCRLILLLGMGGMGKTALSVKLAQVVQGEFECVLWRSLRDAPPLEDWLAEVLPIVSQQREGALPPGPTAQIARLVSYLRQHRCLLVLDNAESLLQSGLQSGGAVGHYLPGYEGYGELLRQVGECAHQSCLILTSREKPGEIAALEGEDLPVRSYVLPGLKAADSQALFQTKGLLGTVAEHQRLIDRYWGNPLALKVVASSIKDLFGGDVEEFLRDDTLLFSGIRPLLQQQCGRLSDLETQVMTWLAIHREWVSLAALQQAVGDGIPRRLLLEALESLGRRSLIERGDQGFTQQPVVMEYLIESLLAAVLADLMVWGQESAENLDGRESPWFHRFPLIQASAKEYIRQSQVRVILVPLADRLRAELGSGERLAAYLWRVLNRVRIHFAHTPSYSAGNLLNLLTHLEIDLTAADFSRLWIRQAHLVNTPLHRVSFVGATFEHTVFAQPSTYSRAVAFSPVDDLLATADYNHLCLWSLSNLRLLRTLRWTWRLAFSPDGRWLASGSNDNVAKVWEVATGRCLKTLDGEDGCASVAFSPDGAVLAGSYHNQVRLWDTATWEPIGTLAGHTQRIAFVAIAPVPDAQGRVIVATGSHDYTVRLWDLHRRHCLHCLEGHQNLVWHLAFNADGTLLATSSMDGTIGLWEVATGTQRTVLRGHRHIVSAAVFIPHSDLLVSSSFDHTLKYWDSRDGTCLHTTLAHRGEVWSLAASADGTQLASVGNDKAVKLWEVATRQCTQTIRGSSSQIYGLAAAGPGQVVTGGDDELARLWEVATGSEIRRFEGHQSWVWAVAVRPDSQQLATAGGDSTLKLWDMATGQCTHTLAGHTAAVYGLAFSADGHLLASGGADAGAKLWDTHTGECLRTFEGHGSWVWACVLASHHPWLVTASNDEIIKIWDIHSGDCLRTLSGHGERIWAVALSPDDSLIASASEDATARLWDIHSGDCLHTLSGHTSQVKALAFCPSGQYLATGSQDSTLKLWDVATGTCLRTFTGHTSAVSCLTFLPHDHGVDPPYLVSGSHDETLRLWDITTGTCLKTFRSPRLYEGMIIAQAAGLDDWAITALEALGAERTMLDEAIPGKS
ncbi:hypothetical protein GFS31_42570 (plasmid) [Leptolyngbya sp. BL0902]|uniref:WD40 domain-containing protein n=1 Tax=Leptolyngbya sp. BL0902 TaxID=1115757 RepID=UPI0018E7A085|nr:NB-ARC domain-containing protein [Leptolyngbya sp. BL0902]QQE67544.1 hypothetical protein GFS31_42570 [Leptolyngbya sp. BL0902]